MSLESRWILWEETLSRGLTWRLIKVYCPVVLISPALSFEIKTNNSARGFRVINNFVFNRVCVYHGREYAGLVENKFWFLRFFFFSISHSRFHANIASENVSHVRTKECRTRSFICEVNLNFLLFSRHIDYDRSFCLIVSLSNERAHGLTQFW